MKRGYLKENPKKGVELYPDMKGERFLSAEEFQRLGEALRFAETDGIPWTLVEGRKAKHRPVKEENRREFFNPHVVAAFRLLLFTGCRLGEILTLKWDYVDFQRGMLNLPDSKTGKKSVLLASPALQVLSDLPRLGPYVIGGQQPNSLRADLQRPWRRLTAHAGLKGLRIQYQSFVARLESGQRRVDVVEFLELAAILGFDAKEAIKRIATAGRVG